MEKPAFLMNPAALPPSREPNVEDDGNVAKGANIPRKRNVLGRGLSALMTASAVTVDFPSRPEQQTEHEPQSSFGGFPKDEPLEGGLIYLSIDRVTANKSQPRQNFLQDEIEKLAQSIKKSGLLQPIVVRRKSSEAGPLASYEIVAGERRWRAAKQAGLVKIPALLKQINDREALELGIVENVQRADLNPIEEALAYQRLTEEFGASQSEVASTVGKDRVSIANALRLLKLAPEVQKLLVGGELTAGHGRALLAVSTPEAQLEAAQKIIKLGLSVRAAEELASQAKAQKGPETAAEKGSEAQPKAPSVLALEDRLRRALGTKVKLIMNAEGKGELRVSFFSAAELESLLDRFKA